MTSLAKPPDTRWPIIFALFGPRSRKLVDHVVANRQPVSPNVARRYRAQGAEPVVVDLPELQKLGCRVVLDNLLDERDVIRHNHKRLAKLLLDKFCGPTPERSKRVISSRATSKFQIA
jgi:hypothetical protein